MDVLTLATCLVEVGLQFLHGATILDSHCLTLIVQGGLRTRPHDVVDGEFVTKHYLSVLVDIDDCCQCGIVEAEEVEERGVLTEAISVVGIVHAHFHVSEE